MKKQPSLFGGACIIAGVCVGAGMLGTMLIMTFSGWLLLDVYKDYDLRASFNTVTQNILGNKMNVINNIAVYFVGGILLYAYITASGGILENLTHSWIDLGEFGSRIWSIIFVGCFSFFVWHSTHLVDRISVILILFMAISFVLSISGLITNLNVSYLFDTQNTAGTDYAKYVLAVFPVALTSFGYHHSVSSMRAYYGNEKQAKYAISIGTFIALVLYLLWVINILETSYIKQMLNAFSIAAILSSFIGVGLGTFDFLADFFKFDDNKSGRTKAWAVTFLPPLFFSLLSPLGFLKAIGYAGAVATLWTCMTPALLAYKTRRGNRFLIAIVFFFGVCTALFHFLAMWNVLPVFKTA